MSSIIAILAGLKAWIEPSFGGRLQVDSIEINPVIFSTVQQAIKKEIFAKSPVVGDLGMGVYSIEGVRIVKSKDPLSGIHIRFKEIAEPEYCPICGLPPDLCICKEMSKEKERIEKRHTDETQN